MRDPWWQRKKSVVRRATPARQIVGIIYDRLENATFISIVTELFGGDLPLRVIKRIKRYPRCGEHRNQSANWG